MRIGQVAFPLRLVQRDAIGLGRRKASDASHPALRLVQHYTALQKPEDAAKWRKELDARKEGQSDAIQLGRRKASDASHPALSTRIPGRRKASDASHSALSTRIPGRRKASDASHPALSTRIPGRRKASDASHPLDAGE